MAKGINFEKAILGAVIGGFCGYGGGALAGAFVPSVDSSVLAPDFDKRYEHRGAIIGAVIGAWRGGKR